MPDNDDQLYNFKGDADEKSEVENFVKLHLNFKKAVKNMENEVQVEHLSFRQL